MMGSGVTGTIRNGITDYRQAGRWEGACWEAARWREPLDAGMSWHQGSCTRAPTGSSIRCSSLLPNTLPCTHTHKSHCQKHPSPPKVNKPTNSIDHPRYFQDQPDVLAFGMLWCAPAVGSSLALPLHVRQTSQQRGPVRVWKGCPFLSACACQIVGCPNQHPTPSALLATGIWMLAATYWELPVSSTQVGCLLCLLCARRALGAAQALQAYSARTAPRTRGIAHAQLKTRTKPTQPQSITASVAAMALVAEGFGSVKWWAAEPSSARLLQFGPHSCLRLAAGLPRMQ